MQGVAEKTASGAIAVQIVSSRVSHVWMCCCTAYGMLGVEPVTQGNRVFRELVLVRGGAIDTPQLLMLSGIGDRQQLAAHGIDVVQHAPEVGKILTDHLCAPLGFDANETPISAPRNRAGSSDSRP